MLVQVDGNRSVWTGVYGPVCSIFEMVTERPRHGRSHGGVLEGVTAAIVSDEPSVGSKTDEPCRFEARAFLPPINRIVPVRTH